MQEYPKLISIDVVKQALGLTTSDKDTVLDRYVGWVSNAIQRQAGQPIAQANVVVPFSGANCHAWEGRTPLKYYPVSAVVSWRSKLNTYGSAFEAGTLSDFEIVQYGELYLLRGRNGFDYGRYYEATLTVGYAEVPGEIQRVAMEMVLELVKQSDIQGIGRNRFGLSSVAESDSKTGITKTTTLLDRNPVWKEAIAHYAIAVTV